jgi:hypothetical protein
MLSMRAALSILAIWLHLAAGQPGCFDRGHKNYSLAWAAEGRKFFDDWDYGEIDYTNGAVRYVGREEATNGSLTQAFDSHAIIKPGHIEQDANGKNSHRQSVRLSTSKSWTYFLVAMRYQSTPFGCGVWPAFWSNGASGNWPTDGELDILEYWNHAKSEVSFHTAVSEEDGCKLDKEQLRKPGCPQFDDVNNWYLPWWAFNCQTDYNWFRLGCAPTSARHQRKTGEEYGTSPGVIAAEWTQEFIKVFYIPESQIPTDLEAGSPKPDSWDEFIISYYPFGASERAHPGTCPLKGRGISSPQAFVLNIELCGGRGSLEFPFMCNGVSTCRNRNFAGARDCCTEYMTDETKSGEALAKSGFFNISYIKVWQDNGSHEEQSRSKRDEIVV